MLVFGLRCALLVAGVPCSLVTGVRCSLVTGVRCSLVMGVNSVLVIGVVVRSCCVCLSHITMMSSLSPVTVGGL